jgi:hypothetical protein
VGYQKLVGPKRRLPGGGCTGRTNVCHGLEVHEALFGTTTRGWTYSVPSSSA